MNIIFTGGGTGGHLYPAIATARAVMKSHPGSRILFLGNRNGVEASIVPREGFEIGFVNCSAFSSNPAKIIGGAFKILSGTATALSRIAKFKPDVVVGSGGYVSAPVTLAAFLKRIPIVLLEQHTVSGKTNRFVGRLASKVCVSFECSAGAFPKGKAVLTGNPVRDDILAADREESRRRLGIPGDRFCLLVTGASQGAKSINDAILKGLESWKGREMTVIHITGEKNYEEIKSRSESILGDGATIDYRPVAFMDNISEAYAACDLAAARAGATTIAELTARGIPSILIPYPHAAEDHQRKNAEFVASMGAAEVIPDSELLERLGPAIEALASSPERLGEMSGKSRAIGRPSAVLEIMKVLEGLKGIAGKKVEE